MKIKVDTITRTVCLAITLINQVLAITGKEKLPIAENDIYQIISLLATIGVSIWTWWKNNSFTQAAIQADEVMHELKTTKE